MLGLCVLAVTHLSHAEVLVPEGNQQVRWRQFLDSITSSTVSRCMPYGKNYVTFDYDRQTNQYPMLNETVVTKYMRINNGVFQQCTAQEAQTECFSSSQAGQYCTNFNEQYTKCTDTLMTYGQYIPYVCRNAQQLIASYTIDFDSPYSEAYKRNEIGDYRPKNACGMNCGDPIQLNTGNSFQKITDYRDPLGRGFDFIRYYNSLVSMNFGMLQRGWTHSYLKSILTPSMGNSATILYNDDGAMYQIAPSKDPKFSGYIDYAYDDNGNISQYILVYPDWGREYYSSAGKLQKTEKWEGATINVDYLPWPGYYTMTDDLGRKIEVQPGALTFVLPNGANLSYDRGSKAFSLNGQIKDKGVYWDLYMTSIQNSSGVTTASWAFDMTAKKGTQSIYNSGANQRNIVYNDDLNMTVKDEFNNTYTYIGRRVNNKTVLAQKNKVCASNANGCVNEINVYEHDQQGNTVKYTSATEQSCYFYDQQDRMIKSVEGLAPNTDCSNASGITYSYTWHPYMNRLTGVAGPGLIVQYQYGDNFMVSSMVTKATTDTTGQNGFLANVSGVVSTESYVYNSKKLITQQTINGKTTSFDYTSNGFILSKTLPGGFVFSYSNHTLDGLPRQIVTPSGLVVTVAYDGNNNMVSLSTDEGDSSTWTYLADGTLTQTTKNGVTTTYAYDANARPVSVQSALASLAWSYAGNSLYPTTKSVTSQGKSMQRTVQYNELGQPVLITK